jgi:NDP-sugar pyrophosphorylase family protein
MDVRVDAYISAAASSPFGAQAPLPPWVWTGDAAALVTSLIGRLDGAYRVVAGCAVHASAQIEDGAQLKAPAIIGPDCFVARTALIRGGCWLERACIIGPACELKSSFIFAGSKLAHLNFVGDSVLGGDVNIEAGAVIANFRNERADKRIRIRAPDGPIDTGVDKFGALVGDHARIGANAVLAPGALIAPGAIVARLALIDQG